MKPRWKRAGPTLSRALDDSATGCLGLMGLTVGLCAAVYGGMTPGETPALVGGAILGAGGLALAAFRRRAVLDGANRTWTDWSGPRRTQTRVDGARVVDLTCETQTCENPKGLDSVVDVYDVTLGGTFGSLRLDRLQDEPDEARRVAESVARCLRVTYRDRTVKPAFEKKPDELDESLVDRHRRLRKRPPKPRPPARLLSTLKEGPRGLEILIPRTRLADPTMPLLILGGILAAAVVLGLANGGPEFVLLFLLMSLIPALLLAGLPLWLAVRANRMRERILLTQDVLRVESSVHGRHEIPLRLLEELTVDRVADRKSRQTQVEQHFRAGVVAARSDATTARFGGALPDAELEYLRDLLVQRILLDG